MFSRFGKAGSPWPIPRDCRRAGSCCFSIPLRRPAPSTPLRSDPPRHRFTRCSRSPSCRSAGGGWSRSTRSRTWPRSSWCSCIRGDTRPKPRPRGWPQRLFRSAGSSSNTRKASGRTRSASRCARAGYFAAGRSIESRESGDSSDNRRPPLAAAAGFLLGLATGVRYQNAVILAVVAGGIALWSAHRRKTLTAYVVAAAAPLSASAVINHIRLGSWNPISKGDNYLTVPLLEGSARLSLRSAGDVLGAGRRFFCPAAHAVPLGELRPCDRRASHDRRHAPKIASAIVAMGHSGVNPVHASLAAVVPDAGSTSAADAAAVACHPCGPCRVRLCGRISNRRPLVQSTLPARAVAPGGRRVRLGARRVECAAATSVHWSLVGCLARRDDSVGHADVRRP